jgi:hypothetical protein
MAPSWNGSARNSNAREWLLRQGDRVMWHRHSAVTPPSARRFRKIDRVCNKWIGAHDVHWVPTVRGDALVAQCSRCRVVISVVVQQPSSDFPGCID